MNSTDQPLPASFKRSEYAIRVLLLVIVYLCLSWLLIGFKSEQVYLSIFFLIFYFATSNTRRFILGFSIFIIYWIVFDLMKAIPNYRYNAVHIADLYQFEKHLFGVKVDGRLVTPNEYWLRNGNTILDVAAGCFYLTWVPVPLLFAGFLFYRDRKAFFYFSLTFFLVNIIGFTIYYMFPAAPPWYVQQHGFIFDAATKGNTAGLGRFDRYFGVSIFKSIYGKSSNVFAAMPSLHSAYPLIVFYFGLKKRLGAINVLFALIMMGIWFSAVYTSHHYVLDILAGISCAICGIIIFDFAARNNRMMNRFLDRMMSVTR